MLTPDYLMDVAEPMVELWSRVECDILEDIARRLVKNGGRMTATASWQTLKARELGVLQTGMSRELARMTKLSEAEVQKLVVKACEDALAFDDAMYLKAGYAPIALAESAALMTVVKAGIRKTNGLMRNFTNTTANTATKAFENALDRAYMQVLSGAFSYEAALANVIRDLAQKGIERIVYPSGHRTRMDAAARRALLTGLNQTTAELQLARMDELGTHLIEVTSHAGARPTHAVWQGQVYWHGEKVSGYKNFEDSTGYGTGDGLCGWNCYHSFFPFFEGISKQSFERDPAARLGKSNDQVYEESQKQRYHERQIRDARRECVTYAAARDAAKDPQTKAAMEGLFNEASAKLKRRENKHNQFIEETGRTKLNDRLRVVGYNRGVSSKVSAVNRKYSQYHYHKDGTIVVTDNWKDRGHFSIPSQYMPFAVADTYSDQYKQIDRTYYDAHGAISKQVHGGPHGKKKVTYLNDGVHVHDFEDKRRKQYPKNQHGRDLTEQEKRENGDLIEARRNQTNP